MKKVSTKIKRISSALLIAAFIFSAYAPAAGISTVQALSINPIQNPSFEIGAATPTNWVLGGWGTNTHSSAFPVAGMNGGKAARVTITAYTDGDTKWAPDTVPVEINTLYRYNDWYNSTVSSTLIAAYTLTNGTNRYVTMGNLASSGGNWQLATQEFTTPADAVSVSVYHAIAGVGSLTIDNALLTKISAASANAFTKGIVSVTFDDGWSNQYDNALPVLTAKSIPASFYIITTPMNVASYDFFTDPNESITTTTNANGTTWSNIYPDPTNTQYRFIDTYNGNSASTIKVAYTPVGSSTVVNLTVANVPSPNSTSTRKSFVFTVPASKPGTTISVSHTGSAAFTATNPSLLEYNSNYMSKGQILELQALGHEVGGHTLNHCNLATLPSTTFCAFTPAGGSTTVSNEVNGSRSSLLAIGAAPVDTFAYPNGGYNSSIKATMQSAGFSAARTVDEGYNTKLADKFALATQVIEPTVTLNQFKAWVDYADTNKVWLILTYHQVSDPAAIASNGEEGGVSPAMFADMMTYLNTKRASNSVLIKTVHDTIPLMTTAPVVTIDASGPTITMAGSATMTVAQGATFTDPGANASDIGDGNLTSSIIVSGTVNTAVPGTYTRTYTVTDSTGFTASTFRTVTVTPTGPANTAPVVTLIGSASMTINVGTAFTDPGATALDAQDGNITALIVATGTVNTAVAGTYTRTYSVTDTGGLSNQKVRTVIVTPVATGPDTQDPNIVTGLVASNKTSTSFTLSWSPATDPAPSSGIAYYEIYGPNRGSCKHSGNLAGYCGTTQANVTTINITGLVPHVYTGSSGSYAGFTVLAADNAGHYSDDAPRLTVTLP